MEDLSRCNDIVNAVSNGCKRLVRCADGSVILTTHEPVSVDKDILDCEEAMDVEGRPPPRVFTERFKKDLLDSVLDKCMPGGAPEAGRADAALCRATLPGLVTVRTKLRQKAMEMGSDTLTAADLSSFFGRVCTNELCVRDTFGVDLPPLNVSHPPWFYFPEDEKDYAPRAMAYVKSFLAYPCSSRCVLCDTFFALTEEDEPVDLYGLPEQFKLRNSICCLYGRYEIDAGQLDQLKIVSHGSHFVANWKGRVHY